jgi:uncharacterized membrane protein YkvA (DUF1232 family)
VQFGIWRERAASLKNNTYALYLASRDARTPFFAKLLIGVVVAYALSPIDLIPDFIPVIGYLDDLLLVPLGIWLAMRLIPRDVWQECRAIAIGRAYRLPHNRRAAVIIVFIWILTTAGVTVSVWHLVAGIKGA